MYYTVFDPNWEKYGILQQIVERAEYCTRIRESLKNDGFNSALISEKAIVLFTSNGEHIIEGESGEHYGQVLFLKKYNYLTEHPELINAIKSVLNG